MSAIICSSILKSGKRRGMECGRKNCKLTGHRTIFQYLNMLLNEPIFLLLQKKCNSIFFDDKKLINIFESSKNGYNDGR